MVIPDLMCQQQRWINHDAKKRPINPANRQLASVTNPKNWTSLNKALQTGLPLGYVLGDGIGCIDLDHCINHDGKLTETAQKLVAHYPENWIEYSPSGTGLHIWGTAPQMRGFRRTWRGLHIEFYSHARYITITGKTYQKGCLAPL